MMRCLQLFWPTALVLTASLVFLGCGGGTSGGEPPVGTEFLELSAEPSFGEMGTAPSLASFSVMTPSALSLVGPNDFSSAVPGDTNFLELTFSGKVLASSITNGLANGNSGIVVRNSAGDLISFFLDSTGAIDPSNAFPAPGVAPATLRLYFEDANAPGTPIALPADKYSVALLQSNLKGFDGGDFCVVKESGLCINNTNCVYHFTIDGFNSPGGPVPMTSGPTVALPLPQVMAVDDELRIFFSDHVDFQSLVGFNSNNGRINVTTQDPFVSIPFPYNQLPAVGANFRVNFTEPAPLFLPPNYGFIVYMPNPFRDPTEVRIRFVDASLLNPLEDPNGLSTAGTPSFQNYALPSSVWRTARLGNNALTPPTDNNPASTSFGQALELPNKLSLPGSSIAGPNQLTVIIFGPTNPNASDSSASNAGLMDGVMGVTDRARRPLAQDITITRTMADGPLLTTNPIPPDLHLVVNGRTLDGLDSAGSTLNGNGGDTITGNIFRINQNFNDINILESISDIGFGAFFNPSNLIINPPRRANRQSVVAQKLLPQNFNNPLVPTPGVPFPPGQVAESALLPPPNPPLPAPPFGLRLYVADNVRARVQVLDSYTFQPLGMIPGLAAPRGLGVGGAFLYVSNFDQATISRVGINPAQSLSFHKLVSVTPVGSQPTTVSVQPGQEDVLVINSGANTVSFVDIPSFIERAQLPVGLAPKEIVSGSRWTGPGTTGAYQAYITNQLSNSLSIYESDTPLITEPNGPNGKMISEFGGLSSPLYGVHSGFIGAFNGIGAAGMLVPNSAGSSTTYVGWTNFGLGPPPGFMGPPSFRVFSTVIEYVAPLSSGPSDCTIENFTLINTMTPRMIFVTYPGTGQVATIDYNNGVFYGAITLPGNQIFSFLDQ